MCKAHPEESLRGAERRGNPDRLRVTRRLSDEELPEHGRDCHAATKRLSERVLGARPLAMTPLLGSQSRAAAVIRQNESLRTKRSNPLRLKVTQNPPAQARQSVGCLESRSHPGKSQSITHTISPNPSFRAVRPIAGRYKTSCRGISGRTQNVVRLVRLPTDHAGVAGYLHTQGIAADAPLLSNESASEGPCSVPIGASDVNA
jgi:hypothetical protein